MNIFINFQDHCHYLIIKRRSIKNNSKKLLNRYIPSELFERPKQGFLVPLNDVLQNKITDIEKILNEDLIRKQGILNPEVVSNELNQFKFGNTFNIYNLWDIINFQMWINKNLKNIAQ